MGFLDRVRAKVFPAHLLEAPVHTHEEPVNFGAITGGAPKSWHRDVDLRGAGQWLRLTLVESVLVRNDSSDFLTVFSPGGGSHRVARNERKRIDFPGGTQGFQIIPNATVTAGQVTGDLRIRGCRC